MVGCKAGKQSIHLRDRGVTGVAGFEARDRLEESRGALFDHSRFDAQGNPEAGAAREIDFWRHHSDDRVTLSVQPDHSPNDVAVRAQVFAPNPIRQDYDGSRAHLFVGAGEVPAEHGGDPQHAKEVVRHGRALHLDRLGVAGL